MVLKYNLKPYKINMKTRGIIISRKVRTLNSKGEEVFKREYLRSGINAAVPSNHRMTVSERF